MYKVMALCLSSILVPCACIAMNDSSDQHDGCHRRHQKTLPRNPTASLLSSTEEITLEEENFLLGWKCLFEERINDAVKYFENSAAYGEGASEYNLGVIYEEGALPEIPRNLEKAEYWYRRANKHGEPNAKEALERVILERQSPWFHLVGWLKSQIPVLRGYPPN